MSDPFPALMVETQCQGCPENGYCDDCAQRSFRRWLKASDETNALREENERLKQSLIAEFGIDGNMTKLKAERDKLAQLAERYRDCLEWIASQKDLMFMECSQAEEIISRVDTALGCVEGEQQRSLGESETQSGNPLNSKQALQEEKRK